MPTISLSEENCVKQLEHICPRNYVGSSKSMETDAALHLYIELFESSNRCLFLKVSVADDDSSMRALFEHRTTDLKGRLPSEHFDPE